MDFVYPKVCVGCGIDGTFLCNECFENLEIAGQICPVCGVVSDMGWTHKDCRKKGGLDGLICIYSYQDELVKKVIDEIKFGFNQELIYEMLRNFRFESGERFDMIVPLPLHFYRENWRGFNQADLIGQELEKGLGIGLEKVLVRHKMTKQQSALSDRKEREENLKDAFVLKNGATIKGKKMLLVDDVFTSGASMKEATVTLKRAGAETVWGLVLAH